MERQPPLGVVLRSEALLQEFAKDLLQVPRPHESTTTHPLSVLLFLLDLLSYLHRDESNSGAEKRAMSGKGSVGLGLLSAGDVTRSEIPLGVEVESAVDGELEGARAWERRNAGSSPSSPEVSTGALDDWKAFSAYLAELVRFPAPLMA